MNKTLQHIFSCHADGRSCRWQICLFLSGNQKTEEIIIRTKFHDKTEQEYTAAHKEHYKDGCLQMEQVSYKDAKSRQDPPGNVCPDLYRNVSEPFAYKNEFAEGFGKGLDTQTVQCEQRIAVHDGKDEEHKDDCRFTADIIRLFVIRHLHKTAARSQCCSEQEDYRTADKESGLG